MPNHKWIRFFGEIGSHDAAIAGSKAASLGELVQAGFPVPMGFCVTTDAYQAFLDQNTLTTQIEKLMASIGSETPASVSKQIEELVIRASMPESIRKSLSDALHTCGEKNHYAVRSSAVGEDLPDASFAGQLETYLNITGETEIFEKVKACWASLYTERSIDYRLNNSKGGDNPAMSVVVQVMAFADMSGVMFTADPVTGDRSVVLINASFGLGEAIVSGQVSADVFRVKKSTLAVTEKRIARKTFAIRPLFSEKGGLAKENLSENLSNAQSVSNREIRELAKLAKRIEEHYGVPQDIEWAIHDSHIFITQARPITALPVYREWKAQSPGLWLRQFRLGEWLGNPVTPLFRTWLLEKLDERIYANFERATGIPTPKPYHAIVNGWYFATGNFLPKGPLNAIHLAFRYLIPGMIKRPVEISILFTNRAHLGMKLYEKEWRASIAPAYGQAIEVARKQIENASPAELVRIIDTLSETAGDNFYSFIAVGGSAWKPEMLLSAFYRKYLAPAIGGSHLDLLQGLRPKNSTTGEHAVLSLDWYYPTLGELATTKRTDSGFARKTSPESERKKAEEKAKACFSGKPALLNQFEKLLAIARDASIVREEQAALLTLAWPIMRRILGRLGDYLIAQGIIDSSEDVFFMTKEELLDRINKKQRNDELRHVISERKSELESEERLSPPTTIGVMSFIAKRIFGGVERNFGVRTKKHGANVMLGIPASAGKATGLVRIIGSPREFDRLQAGEILVAPVTTPAWTPLFAIAAGVITDIGSIMAHASLVAREYGIPAVIGTIVATTKLKDGQMVTVDGNAGTVDIHYH